VRLARRRRGDVVLFEAVHADWHLQPQLSPLTRRGGGARLLGGARLVGTVAVLGERQHYGAQPKFKSCEPSKRCVQCG
jgi:hypothetical protein